MTPPGPIALRDAVAADDELLDVLDAEDIRRRLRLDGVSDERLDRIVAVQLRALRQSHAALLRAPRRRLAEVEGRPAGAALLDLAPGPFALVAEIAVLPDARRRGVASALLGDAVTLAGGRPVHLHVDRANAPARALYERFGFREHTGDARRLTLRRPADAQA
jgi:ribosomal protein S18 acetylase RimI-like enzyme